jgi:hypothetical protein
MRESSNGQPDWTHDTADATQIAALLRAPAMRHNGEATRGLLRRQGARTCQK